MCFLYQASNSALYKKMRLYMARGSAAAESTFSSSLNTNDPIPVIPGFS